MPRLPFLAITVVFLAIAPAAAREPLPRTEKSLNGTWQFRRDGAAVWKDVTIPSVFQDHEGTDFHGVGWYQRRIEPFALPAGRRVLVHVQGAATHAEVWWNDTRLGDHLGGWTPFRFDVTDLVRRQPDRPHTLRIRVDEKVGHNTQGFLPVIQPHYGGLWQEVKLLIVPEVYIDDLKLQTTKNGINGPVHLVVPQGGQLPAREGRVRYRLRGTARWSEPDKLTPTADGDLSVHLTILDPKPWAMEDPNVYEIELTAGDDCIITRTAFRSVETKGHQLLLNGQPLVVRGVLNWGYYPPRLAPFPDRDRWKRDITLAKEMGFNLMKFCLWVPPQEFLDLCDEMGMLAWVEYPTWHPKLDQAHREELVREFREFFAHDRNHPSVILRSLTCETGRSADARVVRELYDLAKQMVPGCVVEDDSSWIGWQRVHDFYDDHPYGNNHTWVATLQRLREHIDRNGAKPLILGEAIAADTWVDPEPLLTRVGDARPYWLPGFLDGNRRWLERMGQLYGPVDQWNLTLDSLKYANLMRKYQVETFRRELPGSGYVVSVLRDFPLASMGLVGYDERPKWSNAWQIWPNWHRTTMTLLKTEGDRRSFWDGEQLQAKVFVNHAGSEPLEGVFIHTQINWVSPGRAMSRLANVGQASKFRQEPATVEHMDTFKYQVRGGPRPNEYELSASVSRGESLVTSNNWIIWVVPRPEIAGRPEWIRHVSVGDAMAKDLFPSIGPLSSADVPAIIVARRLDDQLLSRLENGAKVFLLPDGERGSFPMKDHWFLRGGPYMPDHTLWETVPRQMIVELQHFDLAGPVIPDAHYLDEIDPVLLLWDNHDIKEVKTHALVFETKVGKGRLFVSALKHDGATNAAGQWLLAQFLKHVANGPEPKRALKPDTIRRMRDKLREEKIDLAPRAWRFRPDPNNDGLQQNWHLPTTRLDESWKDIRVGRSWESQGHPTLDGWAWYRIEVEVPKGWAGRELYLSFEGVDDHYEAYVNGKLTGRGGDPVTRQTAFDERKSHKVTALVTPGEKCTIAVRVLDWYGAGGIHRPVTLGTAEMSPGGDLLR